MDSSKKRKLTVDDEERVQKSKGNDGQTIEQATRPSGKPGPAPGRVGSSSDSRKGKMGKGKAKGSAPKKEVPKTKQNIKKLVPPRPFPTVPTSESATGPRSSHKEGKNYICITRKTPLAAYLRRCEDIVLTDGYKSLHLSAMGAAIPHLAMLAVSLPPILPFPADEIHTEILTGSVDVLDEVIPQDEDEDITYQTRSKSTLSVVIKIGSGEQEETANTSKKGKGKKQGANSAKRAQPDSGAQGDTSRGDKIIIQEPEQVDMDES
ncbi:hypothetical protein FIBSPDRAFT_925085 [Athelia psychrophila]|uniref:Uncharacterized protein n=1 Tax=Athelia psychrophila TaxID=1759441 RepID=A0A166VCY8_9AGAM|nr:hypothetical protein FIBSPDRAFT_925085 [Fibularhizoctonia sp. CBS 109695]